MSNICLVVSVPMTVNKFLCAYINALAAHYKVTLVTSGSRAELDMRISPKIDLFPLEIERRVSILKDLRALLFLYLLFRRKKFDSVHSVLPKSGLLAMLAARLAGVRCRFHTVTGQVWASRQGLPKLLLKHIDKLMISCSTRVLSDSHSQKDFLVRESVVIPSKIEVLLHGSWGIEIDTFARNEAIGNSFRAELGIDRSSILFTFVGRLNRDKGILDLLKAFQNLSEELPLIRLLIVGPDEEGLAQLINEAVGQSLGRIHARLGFAEDVRKFYWASDVLCLPSYRESLGVVILEAAAAGIPAVASRIYGISDALEDEVTGLLHNPRDWRSLASQMRRLATDELLRISLGRNALRKVKTQFAKDKVVGAFIDFYKVQLADRSP